MSMDKRKRESSTAVPQPSWSHTRTSIFLKKQKGESSSLRQPSPSHKEMYSKGESSSVSRALCRICMEVVSTAEMFRNNNCSHLFCRDCFRSYIHTKVVSENVSVVKCPGINCKGVLEPKSCREMISPNVFDKWENALWESMVPESQRFYCPFKDCSALLVDDSGEKVRQSECPNCWRLFCARCKVASHAGMTCKEFRKLRASEGHDLLLIAVAQQKRWKRCPRCKYFVERTTGCLHITCRCRFEFCYGCGLPWSNEHNRCHT